MQMYNCAKMSMGSIGPHGACYRLNMFGIRLLLKLEI